MFGDRGRGVCGVREWEREQEGVRINLDTLTSHIYTQTYSYVHAPARTDSQTLGTIYVKGNVTKPVCILHISGETAISNPCETVDYACKFSCLQTDGFCCVFLSSATKCESLPCVQ